MAGDGPAVCVRPIEVADGEELRAMFARLSPRSIYYRFHMSYPAVPRWASAGFLNTRFPSGGSLVSVAGTQIVGHAMYVASDCSREAEVGLLVEDCWQSRGVGKLLLSELARGARLRGIEFLTAEVLGENRRALGLFEAVLPGTRYSPSGGTYHVRAPLDAPAEIGKREHRAA
jgi:ribosomal protein S18 acetylase RimI-like enzyme